MNDNMNYNIVYNMRLLRYPVTRNDNYNYDRYCLKNYIKIKNSVLVCVCYCSAAVI